MAKTSSIVMSCLLLALVAGCQTTPAQTADAKAEASPGQPVSIDETSCENGNARSCIDMANFYLDQDASPHNTRKVIYAFQKACSLGSGLGCLTSGQIQAIREESATVEKTAYKYYRQAIDNYEQECRNGSAAACFDAGVMYHKGRYIKGDLSRALLNYEKACNVAYAKACTNLGTLYFNENDVTDKEKGIAHFKKGCDGEDSMACFKLALIYRAGDSVDQSNETSLLYLQKACQLEPSSKFCRKV